MSATSTLYRAIYYVLLTGLILSSMVMIAGGVLSLVTEGALPGETLSPGDAASRTLAGDAAGVVSLGLLGLLATPFAAVVAGIVVSAIHRDLVGALAGLGVAAVMLLSFFLGARK